jgi:hypothetical protein
MAKINSLVAKIGKESLKCGNQALIAINKKTSQMIVRFGSGGITCPVFTGRIRTADPPDFGRDAMIRLCQPQ